MSTLFITGTDTGVGKTFVTRALIRVLRDSGRKVGVMKPCETGCEYRDGELFPSDGHLLMTEAGSVQELAEVCPIRFANPMAPAEAAILEGGGFSLDQSLAIFHRIRDHHDVTLVEGAGGLLVPFAPSLNTADLALRLGTPVLIVSRIGLGTINHTGLTVEAARSRGLAVVGVVFTRCEDPGLQPPGPDEDRNADAIADLFRVKVLGNIPYIPDQDPSKAAGYLDVDSLL